MILLTFADGDALRLGVRSERGVIDVAAVKAALGATGDETIPDTMDQFIASGADGLAALQELAGRATDAAAGGAAPWFRPETELRLGPCVPRPGKIVCVGLNYRRHAEESGAAIPETPVLFSKFGNAVAAHGESVPLPPVATEYDYEAELAVVIGRTARNVGEGEALDYVLGYCNANDVSARDLQTRTSQWLLGKTLDKFLPLGPYLVTADEVGDPQTLGIRCWFNGELRQDSTTADMIFGVAQIVSYTSRYIPLEPGDVLSTGTPEGVILGMAEKRWMKPGDEVVVEVERLGRLRNVMTSG
jgi:2-keto-4-pentenoate hydratase/2-oxohepta-3-ene-1,7-dioic acid hydratase in catechol pathway